MGKYFAVVALFVSALCFSSILARKTPALDKFFVEGKIYCDPCHFAFESRLSFPLEGNNHHTHFSSQHYINASMLHINITCNNI